MQYSSVEETVDTNLRIMTKHLLKNTLEFIEDACISKVFGYIWVEYIYMQQELSSILQPDNKTFC